MNNEKQHKWRICGNNQYLINSCIKTYKPSKANPDGKSCNVPSYCRTVAHIADKNHKDELHGTEIIAMTNKYFHELSDPELTSGIKEFIKESPAGDSFDHEIIGWVKYWSDILKPEQPLDLNLVKALIASESRFKEDLNYNKEHPKHHKKIIQEV